MMAGTLGFIVFGGILFQLAGASFCGTGAIPFRFEVLPSGLPVLGCATPSCFGRDINRERSRTDSEFKDGPDGEDGFLRQGDEERPHFRQPDAPPQRSTCSPGPADATCSGAEKWIGGLKHLQESTDPLTLQCCSYDGLRFSREIGRPLVNQGEVFSGGEVLREGRQQAFDLISDVHRIENTDGSVSYELVVSRMNCIPDPDEEVNDVEFAQEDIVQIVDTSSGFVAVEQQVVQAGAFQEVQQAAFVAQAIPDSVPIPVPPPAAPSCFSGDTVVYTPTGEKTVEQLRIGDQVLSADRNRTSFVPVISFLHRLPHQAVNYQRIETSDGAVLKLTALHFIYKVPCHDKLSTRNLVYAKDIHAGNCIYRLASDGEGLLPTRVVSATTVPGVGAYAPMTSNGDIIVDGVLASCYNIVRSQSLQQTFFQWLSEIENVIRWAFGTYSHNSQPHDNVVDLPLGIDFLLSVMGYIIPQSLLSY